jgi:hypothetical protein
LPAAIAVAQQSANRDVQTGRNSLESCERRQCLFVLKF